MLDADEHDLDAEEEAAVMGIVRSAAVCLHSLLTIKEQGTCDSVLAELCIALEERSGGEGSATRSLSKSKEQLIIENLSTILFDDQFENFRTKIVSELDNNYQLEQKNLFLERLGIARSLPDTTKLIMGNVISSLKAKNQKFLDLLFFKFLESEHHTTKSAIVDLIFNYFPNIYYYPVNYSHGDHTIYSMGNLKQRIYMPFYSDLNLELNNKVISIQEHDNIIELVQMLRAGVLIISDQDHVWKFNSGLDVNSLNLSEIKKILQIALHSKGEDLSEKISLLLESSLDPIIIQFKGSKLHKAKTIKSKFKLLC